MGTVTLAFYAQFTASKAGVNSLTVTWDLERVTRADGTRTALQTGAATNITVGRRGLYGYYQTGCDLDLYDYVATAITSDTTVDQKEVPSLWTYWIAEIGDAAVGSVTGNVGGNVTGSVGSLAAQAQTDVQTALTSQGYTTTRAGYLDTLNGLVQAIWDKATSAITTAGSIGKLIKDFIGSSTYTAPTTPPTAAAIADAVWDEPSTDHQTAGTTGKALSTAGSAADPLTNTVPGSYTSGTAGYALGRIGSGQITTTSIVAQSGNVTTVAGDDYNATDGRAIDWTDANASWPDLTGASILVTVKSGSTTLMAKAGSVVTPTGAGKQVRVQPTAADTRAIGVGTYDFDVQATLSSGRVVTLLTGKWTNQTDYSA